MAMTLSYLLLLTLGQCVLGQSPDNLCRTDFRYVDDHNYPDDWHLIVDSYDYENLFGGTSGVWELRDVDGTGRQWDDNFGGSCQLEIGACTYTTPNQNNWFFTQYNSYGNAIEVIVKATFRWSRCTSNSGCTNDFVTVYRYDTNSTVSRNLQIDPNRYTSTPITGNEMTSRLQQDRQQSSDITVELRFNRPLGFNGLYLGFRDTGTCGQIKRFQVYYRIAPPLTVGLLSCPEVPLATGRTSSSPCSCAENSATTGNLQRMCSDNGECSELPECICNGGYRISSSGTTCVGCDAGTYRSSSQSQTNCRNCPKNTDTTQIAASQCECKDVFFRAPNEGPSVGCSQPPTAVRNLRVHELTQTTITLRWEKPSITSRDDFYYEIFRSDENTVSEYTLLTRLRDETRATVEYRDAQLTPATTYVYRVIVHNGVSDQDSINVHLRTREVTDTTLDGFPSKPTRVRGFCSVVVWGEPSEPNGKIVGYDLNFYDPDNPLLRNIVYGVTNTVHDVKSSTDLPDADSAVLYVQVRANTSVSNGGGAGDWSDGVPLGCSDACVPPAPQECPSEPVLVHFSFGGVVYPNNSIFNISDIGQDGSSLLCVTNKTACCGNPNRFGEWFFPNGSMVPSAGSNWDFFRGRGDKLVRLSRRNNAMSPTGIYQCKVPDTSGVLQTLLATIIGPEPLPTSVPATSSPVTCPPTQPPSSCPPTVTCPPPEICTSPEPVTCPPTTPVEVHFSFGGVDYPNNSIFDLSTIGQGESALLCVTNKTDCCGSLGEWFFPDGSTVRATGSIFTDRGNQFVRLSRRNNAISPTGKYQCRVPDASGVMQTIQATIIVPGPNGACPPIPPSCPPQVTCPPPKTCPPVVTCPPAITPQPMTPCPPSECPPTIIPPDPVELHFSFGGVDYPNNSIFYLSAVGQDESSLLCVTNKTDCCGSPNRFGEWFFPNGSMVPSSGSNWDFFRGRGVKLVRLSKRNDAMSPTGIYQCKVPDASGDMQTIQATIIGPDGTCPPTATTCPTCPTTDNCPDCPPTVTCTPCPSSSTCPPAICLDESVHFRFKGNSYPNNSIFAVKEIGQHENALMCVTDNANCCNSGDPSRGEWFFPNGSSLNPSNSGDRLFRDRGIQFVRLNQRESITFPGIATGKYRCQVPDANGRIQDIYAIIIDVQSTESSSSTCPPTTDVQSELVTVSTMINDLVILTSIEEFKDIIIRVTVKFTVTDKPEISEMITEDFVNPWVRVPSTILQSQQDSPVSVQVRPEFKNGTIGMFSLPVSFTASESNALFEAVTSGECESCGSINVIHIVIAVVVTFVFTLIVTAIVCFCVVAIISKRRKSSSLSPSYGSQRKDMELCNPTYKAT